MFESDAKAKEIATALEKEVGYVNDNYPGFFGRMETLIAVALTTAERRGREAVISIVHNGEMVIDLKNGDYFKVTKASIRHSLEPDALEGK